MAGCRAIIIIGYFIKFTNLEYSRFTNCFTTCGIIMNPLISKVNRR